MYTNTFDEQNQPIFKFPESSVRPFVSEKSPAMINMFSAEFTAPDNVEEGMLNDGKVIRTVESDEESLNAPGIIGHFDWRERVCSAKASSSSSQGPKSLSGKGQPSRAPVAAAASSDEQMPQATAVGYTWNTPAATAPPHAVAKAHGIWPGVKRCFK
jgi:hypothetical protein